MVIRAKNATYEADAIVHEDPFDLRVVVTSLKIDAIAGKIMLEVTERQ